MPACFSSQRKGSASLEHRKKDEQEPAVQAKSKGLSAADIFVGSRRCADMSLQREQPVLRNSHKQF